MRAMAGRGHERRKPGGAASPPAPFRPVAAALVIPAVACALLQKAHL